MLQYRAGGSSENLEGQVLIKKVFSRIFFGSIRKYKEGAEGQLRVIGVNFPSAPQFHRPCNTFFAFA